MTTPTEPTDGFDLRSPSGAVFAVDPTDTAVEGVVVLRRHPDGRLAGVVGMKNPDADRDEIAEVLEDLAMSLDSPVPTAYKELHFRG